MLDEAAVNAMAKEFLGTYRPSRAVSKLHDAALNCGNNNLVSFYYAVARRIEEMSGLEPTRLSRYP